MIIMPVYKTGIIIRRLYGAKQNYSACAGLNFSTSFLTGFTVRR